MDAWRLRSALGNRAALAHTHTIDDVSGLRPALDEGNGSHGAVYISDVMGLGTALDNKAPLEHSHNIAGVNGLEATLNNKAASNHTHPGLINLNPQLLTYSISQSSTYASAIFTGTYANMTDGVLTNGAGTNNGDDQWIKADLGSVQIISRIGLAGGTLAGWEAAAGYLNGSVLEVSTDSSNWAIVIPSISQIVDTRITTFAIGLIVAQYVRLRKPNGYIACTEFRIFG